MDTKSIVDISKWVTIQNIDALKITSTLAERRLSDGNAERIQRICDAGKRC